MIGLLASILAVTLFSVTSQDVVLKLGDDSFVELKSSEWSLVFFYKYWCSRSRKVVQDFEKAAKILQEKGSLVRMGKVECERTGRATCDKFSVSTFPSIYLFKFGNYFKEYRDSMDPTGIVRFVKTETGPGYDSILSEDDLEDFVSGRKIGVVGHFQKEKESALKKSFMGLIEFWKDKFIFGLTHFDSNYNEKLILYRPKYLQTKFEPVSLIYDGPPDDLDEIEKWMIKNKHGTVGHRHRYNSDEFEEPLVVAYSDLDYDKNPKFSHYWRNRVMRVAQHFPEYNFAVSPKKHFEDELINFGYEFKRVSLDKTGSDQPVVCAYIEGKRYPMSRNFSSENFHKYLEDLKSGDVLYHVKSDEPPEKNDDPVKVAVARNFDLLVAGSDRDALIKFYTPWCGWCKKLTPVWEELAEKLKGENVDIVKFNAQSNEIPPGYQVNGYPTIYWAPRNLKNAPILYNGGRKTKDLLRYIAKHSTDQLEGYDRQGKPRKHTHKDDKEEL